MGRLVQTAFKQFYTTFAWTYDTVAAIVSFGEWKRWGEAALDFLPDAVRHGSARVLEIAHGPGHLHHTMRERGYALTGIDLSPQMGRLTQQRTRAVARADAVARTDAAALARASALRLPFADTVFEAVLSTFPAEFVFHPDTLREVARVLAPGGRFVIVPSASLRGSGALTGLVELAYRVTGQRTALADVEPRVRDAFAAAGMTFASQRVPTPRAVVVVWVGVRL
jgi:ubiquinone/menaquinone biosynthesis C-methylase UbiE